MVGIDLANTSEPWIATYLRAELRGPHEIQEAAITELGVNGARLIVEQALPAGTSLKLGILPRPQGTPVVIAVKTVGAGRPAANDLASTTVAFQELPAELIELIESRLINWAKRRTVVVVDDEPAPRRLLELVLNEMGYEVVCVHGPLGATNAIAGASPRLVLTDLNMPALPGEQLCRLLRNDPRTCDLPVVMVSARPAEEIERAARRAGANGYLQKGVDLEILTQGLLGFLSPPPAAIRAAPKSARAMPGDKRRYPRASFFATWRLERVDTGDHTVGFGKNISRGGLAMVVRQVLEPSTEVRLALGAGNWDPSLRGTIRWKQQLTDLHAIGIEFNVASDQQRQWVDELLDRVQAPA